MREQDALFSVEHSGHFYFKNNFYADSGLLTFLFVLSAFTAEVAKNESLTFTDFLSEFGTYYQTEELLVKVADKVAALLAIENSYGATATTATEAVSRDIESEPGITSAAAAAVNVNVTGVASDSGGAATSSDNQRKRKAESQTGESSTVNPVNPSSTSTPTPIPASIPNPATATAPATTPATATASAAATATASQGEVVAFDGVSVSTPDVWFAVKQSVTEDALKFVVEARSKATAVAKQKEIHDLLKSL